MREWEAAEAHKKALAHEIALKLKEDRAAHLAERDLVSNTVSNYLGRQTGRQTGTQTAKTVLH